MNPIRPRRVELNPGFADWIAGKTVALVGPAPLRDGDLERIMAAEVVYTCGQPKSYGRLGRVDVIYLNGQYSRWRQRNPDLDLGATWYVLKHSVRIADDRARPAIKPLHVNENQVPGALFDLSWYAPGDVTVYGADLYLDSNASYYDGYYEEPRSRSLLYEGIRMHDQLRQRAIIRDVIERTGWPRGDSRFLRAVMLPDDEYLAALDATWTKAPR